VGDRFTDMPEALEHPARLLNLGSTFEALDRPAGAMASYEAALAVRPKLTGAHDNLGNALRKHGRSTRRWRITNGRSTSSQTMRRPTAISPTHCWRSTATRSRLPTMSGRSPPSPPRLGLQHGVAHHILGRFEDVARSRLGQLGEYWRPSVLGQDKRA
jgi:hypothetical protein